MTGDHWTDLLDHPEGLRAVYAGERPPLDGSRVLSVALSDGGGPDATVTLHLPTFPADPPPKYAESNAVMVTLRFSNLSAVRLSGWAGFSIGTVGLTRGARDGVRFRFESPTTSIDLDAEVVGVDAIHADRFDPTAPRFA